MLLHLKSASVAHCSSRLLKRFYWDWDALHNMLSYIEIYKLSQNKLLLWVKLNFLYKIYCDNIAFSPGWNTYLTAYMHQVWCEYFQDSHILSQHTVWKFVFSSCFDKWSIPQKLEWPKFFFEFFAWKWKSIIKYMPWY